MNAPGSLSFSMAMAVGAERREGLLGARVFPHKPIKCPPPLHTGPVVTQVAELQVTKRRPILGPRASGPPREGWSPLESLSREAGRPGSEAASSVPMGALGDNVRLLVLNEPVSPAC